MFKYPEDFIKKCKIVYPEWPDLHYYLDHHKTREVGRCLEVAKGLSIDEDQIISLFRNKKEHKILEAAKRAQEKRNLYTEWCEIFDAFSDAKEIVC